MLAVRKKLNLPRDFLTRQDEQSEKARRKRRGFRPKGWVRLLRSQLKTAIASDVDTTRFLRIGCYEG